MKLHNINTNKNFKIKNLCLCIGNFDGMHKGHKYFLSKLLSESNNKNYLFELKDRRKFNYETFKMLNKEQYIKKIRV